MKLVNRMILMGIRTVFQRFRRRFSKENNLKYMIKLNSISSFPSTKNSYICKAA